MARKKKHHKSKKTLKRIWNANLAKARRALVKKFRSRKGHKVRHTRRRGR